MRNGLWGTLDWVRETMWRHDWSNVHNCLRRNLWICKTFSSFFDLSRPRWCYSRWTSTWTQRLLTDQWSNRRLLAAFSNVWKGVWGSKDDTWPVSVQTVCTGFEPLSRHFLPDFVWSLNEGLLKQNDPVIEVTAADPLTVTDILFPTWPLNTAT